jgi:hypothetical protein
MRRDPGIRKTSRSRYAATAALAATTAMFAVSSSAAAHGVAHAASVPGMTGDTLTLQFTPPVSLNPALGGTAESDVVFGALDYDSLIYQTGNGSGEIWPLRGTTRRAPTTRSSI